MTNMWLDLKVPRITPWGCLLAAWLVFLPITAAIAQSNPKFEPRYSAAYDSAKTDFTKNPASISNAWVFARAAFDLAEFATNETRRAQLAVEGIGAARTAIQSDAKCGPAHYFLAMNLGQLARTQLLGALKLVSEMETHFALATKLAPELDHAGPDRNLGILYREAPGWPASIGSRSKARIHLKKAVELEPRFPANQLELLKAHTKWRETSAAQKLASEIEQSLPAAKREFTGTEWELAWEEWTALWEILRGKLGKSSH